MFPRKAVGSVVGIGGFAGANTGIIANSFSLGPVGANGGAAGGFVGFNDRYAPANSKRYSRSMRMKFDQVIHLTPGKRTSACWARDDAIGFSHQRSIRGTKPLTTDAATRRRWFRDG